MNREIKFRAWHKVQKRMFDVYGFDKMNVYEDSIENQARLVHSIENCVLLEFTGLKDKNGKEVYEADIVKFVYYPLGNNRDAYEYSHIKIVVFRSGQFGFITKLQLNTQLQPDKCYSHQRNTREIYKTGDYFERDIDLEADRVEVIGSIYENPELMEDNK